MDYIIKKLNSVIQVIEPKTLERQTLLKGRIEYILFLTLGYLWNKNINEIDQENRAKIIANLNKISIGQVVEAIRFLDINNEISKTAKKIIDRYPNVRNKTIGHGYTHDDKAEQIEGELGKLYEELYNNFSVINIHSDIIIIESESENNYKGIRLSYQESGLPIRWSCPKELIPNDGCIIDRVFLCIENKYYKISPFIYLNDKGDGVYVFSSLYEKLSGGIKFCRLFKTEEYDKEFPELIMISEDTENRRISINNSIMNYFELNYNKYINIEVKKTIIHFLTKNESYVSATVWGHGGVGKTACIQSICLDFFNDAQKFFSYIVFMSAKNRQYDTKSGEIKGLNNIRTYEEIIKGIVNVVFDESLTGIVATNLINIYEEKIYTFKSKMLIVIDDFETFEDQEKEKINSFIRNLNILHHKVIITTRNKRLAIGENISTTEFNMLGTTSFLTSVMKNEYPEHLQRLNELLSNQIASLKIHEATSGRTIFIYQFAHLFAQHGYSENILENLSNSDNAQKFLYGQLYIYLSSKAQDAFVCISQIINENDMIFRTSVLEFLLSKDDSSNDVVAQAIEELANQKVIEVYDEMYCRVYSKELLNIMVANYTIRPPAFRDTVKNRLDNIGGSDIKGSIYDAMLNEANKSRNIGNENETTEKYKRLLNERNCPKSIKKIATINLTSYLSNDRLNPEKATNILNDFYNMFREDIEINTLYAKLLWSSDEDNKNKAVQLLKQYFYVKEHKKTDMKNLGLFALTVGYCCNNVLYENKVNEEQIDSSGANYDGVIDRVFVNKLNRILNEYGRELFNLVKHKSLNEFNPAVKHNIVIALMQTINLCVEIGKTDKTKLVYCKEIIEYAKLHFPIKLRLSIIRIEESLDEVPTKEIRTIDWWSKFFEKYKVGNIVQCNVYHLELYGAFVKFDDEFNGLIHISQITNKYIIDIFKEISIGQEVTAKIIDIDSNKKHIGLSIKQAL